MFRIGQKVVCVDDADYMHRPGGLITDYIRKGEIYIIREICEFDYRPDRQFGRGVRLVGIDRTEPNYPDYPFALVRFRPIVERETDISIFKKMLIPTSKETTPAL
jgi:hypothetical protein